MLLGPCVIVFESNGFGSTDAILKSTNNLLLVKLHIKLKKTKYQCYLVVKTIKEMTKNNSYNNKRKKHALKLEIILVKHSISQFKYYLKRLVNWENIYLISKTKVKAKFFSNVFSALLIQNLIDNNSCRRVLTKIRLHSISLKLADVWVKIKVYLKSFLWWLTYLKHVV